MKCVEKVVRFVLLTHKRVSVLDCEKAEGACLHQMLVVFVVVSYVNLLVRSLLERSFEEGERAVGEFCFQ